MRLLVLLSLAASWLPGATLVIDPPVIYSCQQNTVGRATLHWTGASGPVAVRVLSATGPQLSGVSPAAGSATTGDWVVDGMQFFLVNSQGQVEASAAARVVCGGTRTVPVSGDSFFPLALGNTWVYRVNSRQETSSYQTRTVTGVAAIEGIPYWVVTTEQTRTVNVAYYRVDTFGRVFQRSDALQGSTEVLVVDPTGTIPQAATVPLGTFPEAIQPVTSVPLLRTEAIYAKGVGLLKSESRLLTGSSGGFTDSLELVEVRLTNGVHLSLPASKLSLGVVKSVLDITNRLVDDCTVPCYFVACGLAPGADPPGTYKPCTQTRVEVSATGPYVATLELSNAQGQVVYTGPGLPGVPGQELHYAQVPLYSAPNVPFPAGAYVLTARLSVAGSESAVARTALQIK